MLQQRVAGWWYPWVFVGAFVVVLAVNMALVFFSTTTFNGLETRHAYEEGNSYNALIAEEETQKELGWTARLEASGGGKDLPADSSRPARLTLSVQDKAGQPVSDLVVQVIVRRPTQEGMDQTITLDPFAPGVYARTIDVARAGQWEVRLLARQQGKVVYRMRERIVVE